MTSSANQQGNATHAGTPSAGKTFFNRVLIFLRVPVRYADALRGSHTGTVLCVHAIALVASTCAFGFVTYQYATELLRSSWFDALGMALVVAVLLLVIDWFTLLNLRRGLARPRAVWALRCGIWFMAGMMAITTIAKNHAEDIDRLQADAKSKTAKNILDNDPRVKSVQEDLNRNDAHLKRIGEIDRQISDNGINKIAAVAGEGRERLGIPDPITRNKTVPGFGEKAKGHVINGTEAEDKNKILDEEKKNIGNAADLKKDAKEKWKVLENYQKEADKKAELAHQGASQRIAGLWEVVKNEPTAWFSAIFGFFISLLPEILLLFAMGDHASLRRDFALINANEEQETRSLILEQARKSKERIAAKSSAEAQARRANRAQAAAAARALSEPANDAKAKDAA